MRANEHQALCAGSATRFGRIVWSHASAATFALYCDDVRTANELRSANDDATRADVGEPVTFRLAETRVRLAQIWPVPPVRSGHLRSG
jgi:hypothetical protein